MIHKLGLCGIVLCCLLSNAIFVHAESVTRTCKDGTQSHAATAAEAASANQGGIIVGQTQLCPEDAALGISAAVGNAKQFLMTRYYPGGCSSKNASKEEGISKLDDQFAVNLAKMLQRAPMTINIISAYRSPEAQDCANKKVKNSNHTKGCAVDLQYDQDSCSSNECQWVIKNAATDALQIRMRYAPEWNHLEPISCNGTGLGGTITSPINAPGTYSPANPGNLASLFTPPAPNPAAQALAQQTIPAMQSAYAPQQATSPTYTGTGGTVNPISTTIDTSGNTNTNANTNNTSALDLINAIAYPTTTTPKTATGSIMALNDALNNTVTLQGNAPSSATGTMTMVATNTYALRGNGQTFVSPDMAQGSIPAYAPGRSSTFAILENLKQTLLLILKWIQPFGGALPRPATANTATAVLR